MIGNDWDLALESEFKKDYFLEIMDFIEEEYKAKTVYPPYEDIFNAFKYFLHILASPHIICLAYLICGIYKSVKHPLYKHHIRPHNIPITS